MLPKSAGEVALLEFDDIADEKSVRSEAMDDEIELLICSSLILVTPFSCASRGLDCLKTSVRRAALVVQK